MVNLRFESVDAATNFRTFLHNVVWQSPEAQMAGEPQYKPNLTLRGLAGLEVKV